MLPDLVRLACLVATTVLLPYFAYLGLVAVAAIVSRRGDEEDVTASVSFQFVIPAHNEQENIAATVESCRSVDYDPGLFRVLVIADNCTDATAEAARRAGAEVIERSDPVRRSKGYALEDVLGGDAVRDVDAVVVIDADTVVDPGLLSVFARAIASGHDWIQCYYTVRNPDASWRTRLMTYAFSLFNGVALLGQQNLGLGAGFKGNGMCLATRGLARVPWEASGLVEDMEFSWRLHARGERIRFLPGVRVYGEMVSRGRAAATQRRRWEAGRREVSRKHLGAVAGSPTLGWYRKILYFLQLTSPPLATLAAGLGLASAIHPAALAAPTLAPTARLLAPAHALMALALLAYALSPIAVMALPVRYLRDLLLVPYYVVWKLVVSAGRAPSTWVRTPRESPPRSGERLGGLRIAREATAGEAVG